LSSCDKVLLLYKAKIPTIWPFVEKFCPPVAYTIVGATGINGKFE
jgi:hypothetical protein